MLGVYSYKKIKSGAPRGAWGGFLKRCPGELSQFNYELAVLPGSVKIVVKIMCHTPHRDVTIKLWRVSMDYPRGCQGCEHTVT